ncbi:MAG: ABC transporter permease [Desulfosarcina sp.]|nr:ABC transporter permease [Desulfobacterales bacterium]
MTPLIEARNLIKHYHGVAAVNDISFTVSPGEFFGRLGYVKFPSGLMLLPVALLGGLALGAIGMFFTGITPTIDMFNLPIFLFITPMFLFSGTFFPVSNLPAWAQPMALAFPLYHLVELVRRFALGASETHPLISGLYLLFFFGFWGSGPCGAGSSPDGFAESPISALRGRFRCCGVPGVRLTPYPWRAYVHPRRCMAPAEEDGLCGCAL